MYNCFLCIYLVLISCCYILMLKKTKGASIGNYKINSSTAHSLEQRIRSNINLLWQGAQTVTKPVSSAWTVKDTVRGLASAMQTPESFWKRTNICTYHGMDQGAKQLATANENRHSSAVISSNHLSYACICMDYVSEYGGMHTSFSVFNTNSALLKNSRQQCLFIAEIFTVRSDSPCCLCTPIRSLFYIL